MSGLLSRQRRRPELNLVPLIDVLVMLIFFAFVTMQFRSSQMLNITLPKLQSAGSNDLKNGVTIAIEKDGKIYFNGQEVNDEQLNADLLQVHNANPETPIIIKGDEESALKRTAFVIDTCRMNGLLSVQLQSRN